MLYVKVIILQVSEVVDPNVSLASCFRFVEIIVAVLRCCMGEIKEGWRHQTL